MTRFVERLVSLRENKLGRAKSQIFQLQEDLQEAKFEEAAVRQAAEEYSAKYRNIETDLLNAHLNAATHRWDLAQIESKIREVRKKEAEIQAEHQRCLSAIEGVRNALEEKRSEAMILQGSINRIGEFGKVLDELERMEEMAAEDAEIDEIAEIMAVAGNA